MSFETHSFPIELHQSILLTPTLLTYKGTLISSQLNLEHVLLELVFGEGRRSHVLLQDLPQELQE